MKKLTMALLVGVLGFGCPVMAQAKSMAGVGPCDDGYRAYELAVCVPNNADYGQDEKKAIEVTKKSLEDHYGFFDYLHIENIYNLSGNGNFAVFAHTQDEKIKLLMQEWKVKGLLITTESVKK